MNSFLIFQDSLLLNSTSIIQGGIIVNGQGDFYIGDISSTSFIFNYGSNITFYFTNNQIFSNIMMNCNGNLKLISQNSNIPILNVVSSTFYLTMNTTQTINIISTNSQIINSGYYVLAADNITQISMNIPFLNKNSIVIQGYQSQIYFTSQYTQQSSSIDFQTIFRLENNPILIINGNLTLDNSNFYLSGNLQLNTLRITNSTFNLDKPLNITGNLDLDETSLFILLVTSLYQNVFLTVSNNVKFASFLYIKLDGSYQPKVGDKKPFLSFGSYTKGLSNNALLIGASYRNGIVVIDGNIGYIEIIFSIGASTNQGYGCTYLGDRKILEYNIYELENKISLSLTVPSGKSWVGFGFDLSNTSTVMVIGKDNIAYQAINHNVTLTRKLQNLLDISTTQSNTLFNIGPVYQSISVFLSLSQIRNQAKIFYAESSSSNVTIYTTSDGNTLITKHDFTETFNFQVGRDQVIDCTDFLAPTRAEIYSLYSYFFILALYIIFFILWIILVSFQPLKSRGISPLLTLIFLILQLSLEARNLFTIPSYQGSLCLYYAYGAFPLLEVNFILVFIYFLRYFSIINLNETKNQFYQSEGKVETLTWRIRILKSVSSIYFILIFTIITLFIILFIFTIVLAVDGFICRFTTILALSTINNIELVFIYILTLLLFIVDIISNYKYTFKCKWIQYIFYNDPHYFRIQIVLFIPFMIYSLIFELFKFFTSFSYSDIVINFNTSLIMNTIMMSLLFIIDVFFPITITLFYLLQKLFRKKEKIDKLTETLNNHELLKMFTSFCAEEFSVENVLVWKDIQTFKKTKNIDLKEFYLKYLNGRDSIMELNVSKSICDEIKRKLNEDKIDDDLFKKLEESILVNLSETFFRFVTTKQYKLYMKSIATKIELLEK